MSEDNQHVEVPPAKKQKLNGDESKETDITEDCEENKFGTDQNYENFVTDEELQKLREFKVLDEVKSNDEDSNDEDSDSSDAESVGLPEDEIERMLEEDLPEGFKGVPKPKEKPYITRQKIVLEEKGVNHFEVLPLDWIMVRHISGIPIYMHRASRVCTASKPYFLGKGNIRRHDIPLSAIPCFAYRRGLEEEKKQQEIDERIEEQIRTGSWVTRNDEDPKTEDTAGTQNGGDVAIAGTSRDKVVVVKSEQPNGDEQVASCPYAGDVAGPAPKLEDRETANSSLGRETASSSLGKEPASSSLGRETASSSMGMEPASSSLGTETASTSLGKEPASSSLGTETASSSLGKEPASSSLGRETASYLMGKEPASSSLGTETASSSLGKEPASSSLGRQPVVLPGGIVMPPPRVETINTSWKTQHLTAEQINEYCKKLYKFKTVNIMQFKRWADRRKYTKARKTLQYPTLPEDTKLITIPAQPAGHENGGGRANKRDWVMNLNDRSYLSVFHEYVRRALQKQPMYEFKQLENASTPYQATVFIGGMQYGVGHGSSKRQAKSAAARASIHILIPEMKDELDKHAPHHAGNSDSTEPDFSFFDYVGIEDPRIMEFCAATCEPSPHAILRTCLLRNFGAGDRHMIKTEMKKLEYQKIELTMKVGKHTATVVCKNKKTAKQRASQSILQALHPHVRSWGSLLRLYGSRSVKSCKEKKLEEQHITLLQDKARHNEPNYAVLEKLRNEMKKLYERDRAVVPIGTLLVREDLPTHSGSNLNNVDL